MNSWFLVKINWPQIPNEYLGLGGNIWPEANEIEDNNYLRKIQNNRTYIDFYGSILYVVDDYSLAQEFTFILKEKKLNPLFISVNDLNTNNDILGYDFGNPEGGYSIIETEIIIKQRRELVKKFLNENFLFKSIALMDEFVEYLENTEDVEDLSNYSGVGIKQICL